MDITSLTGELTDEREKGMLEAIQTNNIPQIEYLLRNGANKIGKLATPILSLAVIYGRMEMVQRMIDLGCKVRQSDIKGYTPLHFAAWQSHRKNLATVTIEENKKILNLLLTALEDEPDAAFANIFLDTTPEGRTPFFLACVNGVDDLITRFLSFVGSGKDIPIEKLVDDLGCNVYHHFFAGCQSRLDADLRAESTTASQPQRDNTRTKNFIATTKSMIEKLPHFKQLINQNAAIYHQGVPLQCFLELFKYSAGSKTEELIDLLRLMIQLGADVEVMPTGGCSWYHLGKPYIETAIKYGNSALLELLLRVGCVVAVNEASSALSLALHRESYWNYCPNTRPSIKIIELLLAFGFNIQKELYLYTIDERPIEFSSPEFSELRDSSKVHPDILESLQNLRRSNQLFSLQRTCRNAIRRHLKTRADAVIKDLNCIPEGLKEFLLVQNEPSVLGIAE